MLTWTFSSGSLPRLSQGSARGGSASVSLKTVSRPQGVLAVPWIHLFLATWASPSGISQHSPGFPPRDQGESKRVRPRPESFEEVTAHHWLYTVH